MLGIQYVQETIVNTAVMAIVGYVPMKENSGVLAALQDAMESTELAVNVLNEMLLYDRLQSGSVSLEKEDIRIWDFLKEAMKPFVTKVRGNMYLTAPAPFMSWIALRSLFSCHSLREVGPRSNYVCGRIYPDRIFGGYASTATLTNCGKHYIAFCLKRSRMYLQKGKSFSF